jgi:hypothetical protein
MPILKTKDAMHSVTLDSKHNEFLRRFKEEEEGTIPGLYQEIQTLKTRLKQKMPIEEHLTLKDNVRVLKRRIGDLEAARVNYFLSNSRHIFGYFEEKKRISEGNTDNVTVLHTFFKLEQPVNKQKMTTHVNAYLNAVDQRFVDIDKYVESTAVCRACDQGELVPVDYEGVVVCNNPVCGKQFRYLVENEKPSYKEPPKEVCFYAYKRINHFREILAQFQAKESTQIPPDILANILAQIKKERIDVATITNKKTKEILKKFGYNKYYEHIPFIKDKLGIKPPVMPPELEDKLCNLFMEIQRPYAKFCPADRVNFLNYYYTIYKLCEILDETQFLQCFPMLKDREKRIEQDEIWKKICNELNWEFIPTV